MKGVVSLVVPVVLGLGGPALAQTLKSPEAIAAQVRAEARPAPDELVKLLESKGILSQAEAALVTESQLQPQTKELLAEMLLSKHLISRKEYDRTLRSCTSTPASKPGSGKAATQQVRPSIFGLSRNGEPGGFKTFSDWITSILPGGGQTTDLDFGTIQPSPLWPPGEEPQKGPAKARHKSKKDHQQDASQTSAGAVKDAPKQ